MRGASCCQAAACDPKGLGRVCPHTSGASRIAAPSSGMGHREILTASPRRSHRLILSGARVWCQSKGFGGRTSSVAVPSKQAACPCGSRLAYKDCCRPYHDDQRLPDTAEALMRSRYSAYANGLLHYIVATTHPHNPLATGDGEPDSSTLVDDVRATCEKINWEKLKVISTEGGSSPDEAFVVFQTYFKVRGQQGQRAQGFHTQSFVERSRFLREAGKWLYVDGDQEWKT